MTSGNEKVAKIFYFRAFVVAAVETPCTGRSQTNLQNTPTHTNSMGFPVLSTFTKIRPVIAELIHADRRIDMTKLFGAFRDNVRMRLKLQKLCNNTVFTLGR
jgi:hypothetical protein